MKTAQGHVPAPAGARAHQHAPIHAQGLGLDSAAVRYRMVERIAQQGITNPSVLAALRAVERHRFVQTGLANQAYEDTSLPIGYGQTISKPSVVARMVELLLAGRSKIEGRVLEIGSGCGYQAAVLGHIAKSVISIERVRELHLQAGLNLRGMRLPRVDFFLGDGMLGYPKHAPFQGIIAAAGGEAIPPAWIDQLDLGARIVAPVAAAIVNGRKTQALLVLEKTPAGMVQTTLEPVMFVPLESGLML